MNADIFFYNALANDSWQIKSRPGPKDYWNNGLAYLICALALFDFVHFFYFFLFCKKTSENVSFEGRSQKTWFEACLMAIVYEAKRTFL